MSEKRSLWGKVFRPSPKPPDPVPASAVDKKKVERTKWLALYVGSLLPPVDPEEINVRLFLRLIIRILKMPPEERFASTPALDEILEEALDDGREESN